MQPPWRPLGEGEQPEMNAARRRDGGAMGARGGAGARSKKSSKSPAGGGGGDDGDSRWRRTASRRPLSESCQPPMPGDNGGTMPPSESM